MMTILLTLLIIILLTIVMIAIVILSQPKEQTHRSEPLIENDVNSDTLIYEKKLTHVHETSKRAAENSSREYEIHADLSWNFSEEAMNRTNRKNVIQTTSFTNSGCYTNVIINGQIISNKEASDSFSPIFNSQDNPSKKDSANVDFVKEFEETLKTIDKDEKEKRREEEKRKKAQDRKIRKELDDIVKFIWPDAKYDEPYNPTWECAFTDVFINYQPKIQLYGMFENLLSNYPKKFSLYQEKWIDCAVKVLLRSTFTFYDDNDTISEKYKYLSSSSNIQGIVFNNLDDFPGVIASMAAWSVYYCDVQCFQLMTSKYQIIGNDQRSEFVQQFLRSLSVTREYVFSYSLEEISAIISALLSFMKNIDFENQEETQIKHDVILYLKQGYDEKEALQELDRRIQCEQEEEQKGIENKKDKEYLNP